MPPKQETRWAKQRSQAEELERLKEQVAGLIAHHNELCAIAQLEIDKLKARLTAVENTNQ